MVTPASNGVIVKSSTVVIAIFLMRCHPLLVFPLIELYGCCSLLDLNSRGRRRWWDLIIASVVDICYGILLFWGRLLSHIYTLFPISICLLWWRKIRLLHRIQCLKGRELPCAVVLQILTWTIVIALCVKSLLGTGRKLATLASHSGEQSCLLAVLAELRASLLH